MSLNYAVPQARQVEKTKTTANDFLKHSKAKIGVRVYDQNIGEQQRERETDRQRKTGRQR